MKATLVLTSVLVLALGSNAAFGQSYGSQTSGFWEGHRHHGHFHFPDDGYGGGGGYGGFYESSVLHGLGSYARGVGEYRYYSALAAREREEARTLYIKNHQSAVDNWLTLREEYQERRRAEREKEKLTPEQVARIVESNRPDRLTPAQYDPATGKLSWPAALSGPSFAKEREAIEAALAKRTARDAGRDSEFYEQMTQLTKQMLSKVQAEETSLTAMQRVTSKNFLAGLRYESLSPADAKGLAVRD